MVSFWYFDVLVHVIGMERLSCSWHQSTNLVFPNFFRLLTVVLDFASFNLHMKTNSTLRSYFQAYTYLGKHFTANFFLKVDQCQPHENF